MTRYQTFLIKTLNLKKDDIPKFTLLFLHSFFVHFFISFQFVPVNSVFVHNFGGEYLPYAYIVAGATGYIVSLIYSEIQKKVHSKYLFLGALAFMFVLTLICWWGVGIVDERLLAFFGFIWAWPFISLVNIESGGLTIGLLNLRQVKRLFGLINIGGIISAILSYFAIPFIMPLLHHTYDLLLVSLIGPVAAIIIVIIIYKRFSETQNNEINIRTQNSSELKFKVLFKERYFRLMFFSAALSMIMIYFTDFGYLSSIKEQKELFPTPEAVSALLAIVCGVFKIGELIISYFSNRLLSRWGVKLGLIILPIFATLVVALATITGLTIGTASFLFFSLMVINKSFERILRRGMEDPSFNILYQPLSGRIKLAVQAKVGVVMQMSIGIGGLLLLLVTTVLKTTGGFQLKFYTLFFLPFLLIWIFVSRNLFVEYKRRLRQILADMSKDKKREGFRHNYGDELLKKNLKKHNEDVVEMSLTVLSDTNPSLIEPYASQLLEIDNEIIRKGVLLNIEPTWRSRITKRALALTQENVSDDILKLAREVVDFMEFKKTELSSEEIEKLKNSASYIDRLKLTNYLRKAKIDNLKELISELLDDEERIVKIAAIKLVARYNNAELIRKIINLLRTPVFCHVASNCLLDIGDKVLPELEKLFENKEKPEILVRAVEIYAKMGSTTAKKYLVQHINYPARDVQIAVIRGLHFCRYQAGSKESATIRSKLEEVIENVLWIYATLNDIESELNTLKLIQALDLERENFYELIFELLSFIYDPKVINLIKKNIIGENTIFALEIIDNFINQEIKQLIIPLFDDISRSQRLKKLHHLFPQQKYKLSDRLKDIIVRNYNQVDPYTIAKAVELLGKLQKNKRNKKSRTSDEAVPDEIKLWTKDAVKELLEKIRKSEMPDEIFACLYHPDEVVYSTAALIIYEENPSRCLKYMADLAPEKKALIPMLEKGSTGQNYLLPKKIKLIKRLSVFFTTPENLLIKIAKIVEIIDVPKNEELFIGEDDPEDIYFIVNGRLLYNEGEENQRLFESDDIIIKGLNAPRDINELLVTRKAIILKCNRYRFFNILATETVIIHHMFEMLTSRRS